MPGFFASISSQTHNETTDVIFKNLPIQQANMVNDFIKMKDMYVERLTVNKFLNDKVFYNDDNFFILTEGVILNTFTLIKKYNVKTFRDCILVMYKLNGETFFNEFRGSFCGIFYDKKEQLKLIFTDHIGSKQLFYSRNNCGKYFISSDLLYIIEYFKYKNINRSLNINASYCLLTLGFMFEDITLFNEIKKILPGHYVKIKNNLFEIKKFFKLKFSYACNMPEADIINELDRVFTKAVKIQFDKDIEYGYKHLVNLSAGLDSRMTTFVANKLGYGDSILNNTTSQTDYWDEIIPKQIASDLKHQWVFKSLDNGLYLYDIEKIIKITCGMSLCTGCSHISNFYDVLNMSEYGIVHTGQIGGCALNPYLSYNNKDKKYSLKLLSSTKYFDLSQKALLVPTLDFDNEEHFRFFSRALLFNNQGLLSSQRYSETFSPFYDVDFMGFCFSIPLEIRANHILYHKWINAKHPNAANYVWSSTGKKINDNIIKEKVKYYKIFGRKTTLKQLQYNTLNFIYKRITSHPLPKKNIPCIPNKNNMNPFDYWYNENSDLQKIINNYFSNNINVMSDFPDLYNDCIYMFSKGNTDEKMQVITLIGMKKMYLN